MNNKLETIYNAFNDIKRILDVDDSKQCVTIEDLPRTIEDALRNNGFTTVFLFSGSAVPGSLPEKPTMNPDGTLSDIGEGWSQEDFSTASLYRRSTSGPGANWMSFARFNAEGQQVSPWSNPVDLKGADGRDGKDGIQGPEGPAGSQGNPGKDGADGTRFEYIYKLSNTKDQLDPPYSANEDGYVPEGWSDKPQGVDDDNEYEWICQREKTNGTWGTWTTPSVWAHYGKIGKDGNGIEYIFCLTETEEQPEEPISDPDKSESEIPNYFPIEVGKWTWTDEPGETTDKIPYCWVSVRKQKYNDNGEQKWTPYSNATIWAKYARDGKEGGGRTVQVYTYDVNGDAKIPAPIGGAWDPESNAVTCPSAGESDSHIWVDNMGLIPSKSEDGKLYHIWQSNGVFNSAGGQTSEGWSEPHRITGADGEPGRDGTSIEFIYRRIPDKIDYNTLVKWHTVQAELGNVLYSPEDLSENDVADNWTGTPSKIDISDKYEGEGWTPIEGTEQYTICDTEWKDSPDGVTEEYLIEVCCQRKYNIETKKWGPWSMPYIWSMWGEDGMDGDGVEYIYLVTPKYGENGEEITKDHLMLKVPTYQDYINYDKEYNAENGEGASNLAEKYQQREFVPGQGHPNFIGFQEWHDEPVDVSEDKPIEWVRIRKFRIHDGETEPRWGDFSEPTKWAMWSTDGVSFKTSYVFAVSNFDLSKLVPGTNLVGGSYDNPIPDASIYYNGVDEYRITWTDAPQNPDLNKGEYLWMTSRTFKAGDKDPDDINSVDRLWSTPTRMADSSTFQVEFTKGYNYGDDNYDSEKVPTPVSLQKFYESLRDINTGSADFDKVEEAWRRDEITRGLEWSDYMPKAVWMATSTFSNGSWSDWTVVKIKGEKGDTGKDGTSVTIEGLAIKWDDCNLPSEKQKLTTGLNAGKELQYMLWQCESRNNGALTLVEWTDPDEDGSGQYMEVDTSKLYNGFGVMIDEYLWIWDGNIWENVGQIKGDVGDKMHLYIAHSDDPAVLNIDHPDGNTDIESVEIYLDRVGKYIGYFADFTERTEEYRLNPNLYTWSKWIGDDGWGWEQIFLLTKYDSEYTFDNPPAKPTTSEQVKDYLPEHGLGDAAKTEKWMDLPDTPTADYPFCWTTRRTASTNEWGDEWEPVTLYSRYVANATHLELSEDHISVPLNGDDEIDLEWEGGDFTAYVYDGDDLRTENITYYYKYDGIEFTENESAQFELDRALFVDMQSKSVRKITIKADVKISDNITKEFTKDIHLSWNKSGYEISTNKHILRKNVYDGGRIIDEDASVTVKLFKWNFDKNVYKPIKQREIYLDVEYQNGTIDSKKFIQLTNDNGVATFDQLKSLINPANLKFYVLKEGSTEVIAFENVGVVANGEDGATEEHVFYLSKEAVTDFSNVDWFKPNEWIKDTDYQNPEWTPTGWYDEYHDEGKDVVSLDKPYLYASARKKSKDESAGEMMWGEFQTPVLWAKYSADASSAKFNKPAVIIPYLNDDLQTTVIHNTLKVYKDAGDDTEIIVDNISIQSVTHNEVDVTNKGLITIKTGESGVDDDVDVEFTINQDVWRSLTPRACNIDVLCQITTKTGTHAAAFEVFVTKVGGESKFSIDLNNEFFYLTAKEGKVDFAQWPSLNLRAYYGTEPIDTVTKIETTVTTNSGDTKTFTQDSITANSDGRYELDLNFAGTQIENWFNTITDVENPESEYIEGIVTVTAMINEKECVTTDTFKAVKTSSEKASLIVTPVLVNLASNNRLISWKMQLPNNGGEVDSLDGYRVSVNDVFISGNTYAPLDEGEYVVRLYHNDVLCDYEPVTVVNLTNPYFINLDPDMEWVATDSTGKALEDYSKTIEMSFWDGNSKITEGVTYDAVADGCYIGNKQTSASNITLLRVSYPTDITPSTSDATVIVTGKYNGVSIDKTFVLKKSCGKPTYKINVPNQVNGSDGATFNITVTKTDGNTVTTLTGNTASELLYLNGNDASWSYTIRANYSGNVLLKYELKDKSGNVLDTEYVTIVKNGMLTNSQQNQLDTIQAAYNTIKNADTKWEGIAQQANQLSSQYKTTIDNWTGTVDEYETEVSNYKSAVVGYQNTVNSVNRALTSLENKFEFDSDGNVTNTSFENLTSKQIAAIGIAGMGSDAKSILNKAGINTSNMGFFDVLWSSAINTVVVNAAEINAENITTGTLDAARLNADSIRGLVKNGTLTQMSIYSGTTESNSTWYIEKGGKFKFADIIFDGNTLKVPAASITDKLTASQIDATDLTASNVISKNGKWRLDDNGLAFPKNNNVEININSSNASFQYVGSDFFIKTTIRAGIHVQDDDDAICSIAPSSIILNNGITKTSIYGHSISVNNGSTIVGNDITAGGKISAVSGFFQTSDERLKTFYDDIEIDFEKLKSIPKKYFTWKDGDSKLQLGTSAQKVQALYPELVNDGDKLSVDYARLSMIALAAVDKLYDELVEVKKELNYLKNK